MGLANTKHATWKYDSHFCIVEYETARSNKSSVCACIIVCLREKEEQTQAWHHGSVAEGLIYAEMTLVSLRMEEIYTKEVIKSEKSNTPNFCVGAPNI